MINMVGKKFGYLTVLERAEDRTLPSGRQEIMWKCLCDCGNIKIIRGTSLRSGNTSSCGCYKRKLSSDRMRNIVTVHGQSKNKLFKVWSEMIRRCNNQNDRSYYLYGGKGIKVCSEWRDYNMFREWSYKNGYAERLTIDRIDSNGNYCPENCRWVTHKVQNNNTSRNHLISYNGETLTMAQWAEKLNMSYSKIKSRLNKYGWSVEKTLTTP